ncbi:MAG: diguanylate cyclase [Thermodesulfobacteriota bacterium]
MTGKVEQKLFDSVDIIEREIQLWFKERSYDLHVFSNSFIINENYSRYIAAQKGEEFSPSVLASIDKISTYLTSVQNQFKDYRRLLVLDSNQKIIAASATGASADAAADSGATTGHVEIPDDAEEQIRNNKYFKGNVYFLADEPSPLMLIGIPLFSEQYEYQVGTLAVEVRLQSVLSLLRTNLSSSDGGEHIYGSLINIDAGQHFLSVGRAQGLSGPGKVPDSVMRFLDEPNKLHEFVNRDGVRVIGIIMPLKTLNWGLMIAEKHEDVFAQVSRSRRQNVMIFCAMAIVIGIFAYIMARQILTPLHSLTNGAIQVANGELDVNLPIRRNDELGITTGVFNEMVNRLRESYTKLEQLATTDPLTGLDNRKQIMSSLLRHFENFRRYGTKFSIMMLDVDHFKNINDTYGHQAGDTVLVELAALMQDAKRNLDSAGRYGGEEFLIILAETKGEQAKATGRRVRGLVEKEQFSHDEKSIQVTISIGVAEVWEEDENADSLISRADEALYKAKREGRNQVVYASGSLQESAADPKVISFPRSA